MRNSLQKSLTSLQKGVILPTLTHSDNQYPYVVVNIYSEYLFLMIASVYWLLSGNSYYNTHTYTYIILGWGHGRVHNLRNEAIN